MRKAIIASLTLTAAAFGDGCIFADTDPPGGPHAFLLEHCGFAFAAHPYPTPDTWTACEYEAAEAAVNAYVFAQLMGWDPCSHAGLRYWIGVSQCE